MLKTDPYDSKDPAYKMQSYNGFSKLMGGAEGVETFRSGIDLTKTPTYGYQSMDYIVNTLASNPWILKEIEKQKKELKIANPPASILCLDQASKGANYLDSKHYFNLHRTAGRMEVIKDKKWSEMTPRQQKVFSNEISYLVGKKQITSINGKALPELQSQFGVSSGMSLLTQEVKTSSGQDIKTSATYGAGPVNSKSTSDLAPLTKFNKGFEYQDTYKDVVITPLHGSYPFPKELLDTINWNVDRAEEFFKPPFEKQYPTIGTYKVDEKFHVTCFDAQEKSIACDVLMRSTNHNNKNFTIKSKDGTGFSVNYKKMANQGSNVNQPSVGNVHTESQKISFPDSSWVELKTQIFSGQPDDVAPKQPNKRQVATMDEVSEYYFKSVYQNRNTVEKASSFHHWTEMPDSDIEAIAKTIKDEKMNGRTPATIGVFQHSVEYLIDKQDELEKKNTSPSGTGFNEGIPQAKALKDYSIKTSRPPTTAPVSIPASVPANDKTQPYLEEGDQ